MDTEDNLTAPQKPAADLSGFLSTFEPKKQSWLDNRKGMDEGDKALISGVQNGVSELISSVNDIEDYVRGKFNIQTDIPLDKLADAVHSDWEPKTVAGGFVKGATQFGVGLAGINKITKPLKFLKTISEANKIGSAAVSTVKGALAGSVAFDPHEARISNFLQGMGVDNSIVDALAAKPDDTNLQGRAKNALEGAGLGFIADSLFGGIKAIKKASETYGPEVATKVSNYISNNQTAAWLKKTKQDLVDSIFKTDDPVVQSRVLGLVKKDGAIDGQIAQAEAETNLVRAEKVATEDGTEKTVAEIAPEVPKNAAPKFTFTPEQAQQVVDSMGKPGPFEQIINTSKMQSSEDVVRAINATAQVLKDTGRINMGTQTWEDTTKLAGVLGSDKKTLFSNLQAIGGTTEEVAAHLEAANSFMQGLADKVTALTKSGELTPEQIADHVNTINLLANVTSQYKGISKNIARGLQILRKNKLPMQDINLLDVNDVLNSPEGRLRYQQMAKLIAAQNGDLTGIAKAISPSNRAWMAFNEYYVNNLLSSPTTVTVNTVTGAANTLFLPAEKALAGMFRGSLSEMKAAAASYKGVFDGMLDAVKLFSRTQEGLKFDPGPMWKVLKTGQNMLDNQNVMDHPSAALDTRFLMNVDPNDLKGIQRIAAGVFDTFGKFIRLPSHVIAASDELLKTMATRGEMTRQLHLDGLKQGLSGDALKSFIRDGIENPTKELWDNAKRYSREVTFTQDLPQGGIGRSVQQFVAKHPAARLFIPFVRTPVNILKFSFTHTPGLNLLVKEAREEMKNDLPMFMAKMATGTTLYTAGANLALNGQITGSGPKNKAEREAWLAAGNQPYSVKIGNSWYQYNRMDPYGSFFGLTADAMDLLAKAPSREADELATIMMSSLARNVTSKTFLRGLSDAITAVSDGDPHKFGTVMSNLASGSVPMSGLLNTINRTQIEQNTKETFDLMDKIAARIPGLSDSLPPVRNIWGEEVKVPEAIGPDLISPFYVKRATEDYKDKIAEEIVRLGVGFGKPDKYIGDPANRFEFTPQQYDRLVTLMGRDIAISGKSLPETLKELMDSPIYKNKMTDGDAAFEGTRAAAILRVRQAFLQTAHNQLAKEFPDYGAYRQRTLMMKAASRREGGDAILQQLSLPSQ